MFNEQMVSSISIQFNRYSYVRFNVNFTSVKMHWKDAWRGHL